MTLERVPTLTTELLMGPFSPELPGALKLALEVDGEVVVNTRLERGYLHRGVEKVFESQVWFSALVAADRLDPESSFFGELSFCLAVEEISGVAVPERAARIRIIVSELARISAHLYFLARFSQRAGAETLFHYLLRERERIHDLFELLAGARFTLNFLRYGGVSSDVSDGFLERVLETCDVIRLRLKEYNDLLSFNRAFLRRTVGHGVVAPEQLIRCGVTGPTARAAGLVSDLRRDRPYCGYDEIDFLVPDGRDEEGVPGDCHTRFILRLREINQSVEILRQAIEAMPKGPINETEVLADFAPPAGEAFTMIESSRGQLGCHVVSDGGPRPVRVQFRSPALFNLHAIPDFLVGAQVEDVSLLIASLDISVAEADR
jgi:NADH-quinone oxidoreductase subunit D